MPRPVTPAERARLDRARQRVETLQAELAAAVEERDQAVIELWEKRVRITEIASIAGVSRQAIHAIVKRGR